jgi:hypothetical protein
MNGQTKPTNQQTNKPTNQQTNKPTNQQTNKPTNQTKIIKQTNQKISFFLQCRKFYIV